MSQSVGKTLRRSKGGGEQPIPELLGEISLRNNSLCRRRALWFTMLAVTTQTRVLVQGPPTGSSLHKCVTVVHLYPSIYPSAHPSAASCRPTVCSDLLSHLGSCLFRPLPAQLVSSF